MAKIKYTKNEIKKQKDQLKRFERYLPTLVLKKQLLQSEIRLVEVQIEEKQLERDRMYAGLTSWVHVFGEEIDFSELVKVKEAKSDITNIAGV
ncbi:MAG: V-type ATP synthase subunit D, partial [Dethiobacteria bacterium]